MIILELFLLGGFIYLLSNVSGLRARIDVLERRLGGAPLGVARETSAAVVPTVGGAPVPAPAPAPVYTPPTPDVGSRFFDWIREDWLLKLGALLLLIGFGWLVSYAFLNNWIGPSGRITLGLVAGALLLAFGWWRMLRFKDQGSIFLVLGATTVLLTIFAARSIYGFFTPTSAMMLMFLAAAFVGLASVRYRVHSLALVGLILASVVPFMVASPVRDDVGLFSYLLLVTLGTLWIVVITGWRDLIVASLTMITLYSFPFWSLAQLTHPRGLDTLTLLAFGFVVLFFVANIFAFLFARAGATRGDVVSAVWTGAFLTFWVIASVVPEWQSLMFALWAVAFVVAAFLLYMRTGNRKPLLAYAGVAVFLLGIAMVRELEGASITIALTLEAAVVTFLAGALLHDRRTAAQASVLFGVPAFLSLGSITVYPYYGMPVWGGSLATVHVPIFHEHFFALLVLALSFFTIGFYFKRFFFAETPIDDKRLALHQVHTVLGSFYALALLWLVAHEVLPRDTGTMFTLVCYTIIGLTAYLRGRMNDIRTSRIYGGALLGVVVFRLLVVDVWNMALTGKIITFFLVGILLMSTAFIGRKK